MAQRKFRTTDGYTLDWDESRRVWTNGDFDAHADRETGLPVGNTYEPLDGDEIPQAVLEAIARAWPDQAVEILAERRHNRDHWYFQRWGMYVGVEYDGYIHT